MIRTFIQITSLILTLEATLFLAKGGLGLSAQTIAKLSEPHWDFHLDLSKNLARQRADTWVGAALLLSAFALQMWNTLWPIRIADFGVHTGAAVYAIVFCVILGFGTFFASKKIAQYTVSKIMEIKPLEQPEASTGASITEPE